MNRPDWRLIRVITAMALIFVLGMVTGRMTAPTETGFRARSRPLPPPLQTQGNGDGVLNHMLAYIDLSEAQKTAIRPILEKWMAEARPHPPFSEARKELFLKYAPELRKEMKPDQLEAFDGMTEAAKIRGMRRQRQLQQGR